MVFRQGWFVDVLVEEIVNVLVERVERQRTNPGEIPFEGKIKLVRQSRLQEWIARGRRQGSGIIVEARRHEVARIRQAGPRQCPRRRETQDQVAGKAEPKVQAWQ